MSLCPAFRHRLRSLWHQFFGTITLMEFVLKNPCQQLCSFSFAPCQRSYMHVPRFGFGNFGRSWPRIFFKTIVSMIFVLKNPCQQQSIFFYCRSLPTKLCMSHRPASAYSFFRLIALMEFVLKTRANSSTSQYIASSQQSSPQAISHGFPSVHPVVIPVSLLPTGALPKLFHTVSLPSTLSSLPYRSFPLELSPSYFTWFPFRPPCRHSRIAPSHRSSPQAISHGFPSVHPVVIPVSLLPTGTLPKLFPTVSLPSTLSSLPYRSFPPELSPSYFTRFPFRPTCRHSSIAPSHRSSPQAISHGFPSVHPVVTPVSLLPTGALPKLFPTVSLSVHPVVTPVSLLSTGTLPKLFHMVSLPSTLSSFQYRSFPPELSPSYFTRFPFRPPCRHSSIAPSHRNSPQAISHGFPSVHLVVTPVPLLPTGALPELFHTVSLPSNLSSFQYRSFPPELSTSYFTRFPFRPPCRHSGIAPSHGTLPKLFVSLPSTLSSLPYRSFPPEPSTSYFTRFPFRPPCRHSSIAPSHRSSPQAISHGFPSVHPLASVSLLPTGALPKLFHTVSLPSTLLSLPYRSPSHRSSPQAISHGFPSVHPVVTPVSLLPTGALHNLFHTVSLPSTLSSFQYRSFPPELSPSYFTRFPFRPPCRHSRIAPSHRSSPQAISHGFLSVHPIVASIRSLPA